MRIAIVGSGYVGLVSGACLADAGHEVTCIDTDEAKVARLVAGSVPIYEPGLDAIVAAATAAGRLRFVREMAEAVAAADVIFIAVGTPSRRGDGHADLSYVRAAAEAIAPALSGFTVVAMKSTVPVGTGDAVEAILRRTCPGADVAVVSNPEFLREGAAIEDFKRPDRVVIGLDDERARAVMAAVYAPLGLAAEALVFTDRRSSELIKYAANAFLALKVTFINETADLCEAVGADVMEVARGMGLDRRIGPKFLSPGPGFGGSCFPKDTLALMRTARDAGTPFRLVETMVAVNDARKLRMAEKVIAACGGSVRGKRIGVLGLTFKPDTDDMRDAPSIPIIETLLRAGAEVRAYDPEGMTQARRMIEGLDYAASAYDCAAGAHALVIVTEWAEFRRLDLDRLRQQMAEPLLVDLRNLYTPEEARSAGLRHVAIGRAADETRVGPPRRRPIARRAASLLGRSRALPSPA